MDLKKVFTRVGDAAAAAGKTAKDAAIAAGETVVDAASAVGQTAKGAAVTVGQTAKDGAIAVGTTVKDAAVATVEGVKAAPGKVYDMLPTADQVKVAVGKSLVTGGKLLIDPKATIGEFVVAAGEGLLADASSLRFFVVRIDDQGGAETFPFVKEEEARQFFTESLPQFPRQYLCAVQDGPRGKPTPPPAA